MVVDRQSGKAIGSTRYLTLRPEHRGLEIGWTWNARSAWGSGANVEAKLLLLRHAFETLGCLRVEFKTEALNERSRAALEALPARFEGIFRKHMLVRDDDLRDSAYYAITDDEWPAVRANLERRLRARALLVEARVELGAELRRRGGDHAGARSEVERGRAERRRLGKIDRQAALANEELRGGDVDAPGRLERDDRVHAACRQVAERERQRAP